MKSLMRLPTISLSLILSLGLAACTKSEPEENPRRITVQSQDDAEKLVNAAEQLITPYTFDHADQILTLALEKDPTNEKAQFLKALLQPMMAMKGLATRAEHLVAKHGDLAKYKNDVKRQIPRSSAKDFLTAPSDKKLAEAADVQELLADVREGYMSLYAFIKRNPTAAFDLRLNPYIFGQKIGDDIGDNCTIEERKNWDGSTSYTYVDCNFENVAIRKVNSADLAVLAQMAAGMYLTLTPYVAYSVADIDPLIVEANKRGYGLTALEVTTKLESSARFGALRANHGLDKIMLFGADLAKSIQWAVDYQKELCPQGNQDEYRFPQKKNRPGFLVDQGICISDTQSALTAIEDIQKALAQPMKISQDKTICSGWDCRHEVYTSSFDLQKLSNGSLKSLKDAAPVKFDELGNALQLKDSSLSGIFPNHDAERFIINN